MGREGSEAEELREASQKMWRKMLVRAFGIEIDTDKRLTLERAREFTSDVSAKLQSNDFKETLKTWTQIYLYETDRLALHLYVPNYRNPEQARYRFNREGAEFIQALPGPADVAVGTRIHFETNFR